MCSLGILVPLLFRQSDAQGGIDRAPAEFSGVGNRCP